MQKQTWMLAIIILGLYTLTNDALHIKDAENGLGCNGICFGCNGQLLANQGKKRDWYFSHHIESFCTGGLETALHKLAKQIIVESKEMILPKYGKIRYQNAILEKTSYIYTRCFSKYS